MAETKPLNTGKFGKGNAGKPKGAIHKTTKAAKDAIADAAEMLGGTQRLVDWVKEDPGNEKVFWGTIYPKLLPLQVNGDIDHSLTVEIVRFGKDTTAE